MALKSPYSFLVIFSLLVGSSLFGVSTAVGGKKALSTDVEVPNESLVVINPKDPKVLDAAKFAVAEYDKENGAKLTFNSVSKSAFQTGPQGTTYFLVIYAINVNVLNAYDANVLLNRTGTKTLISFRKET